VFTDYADIAWSPDSRSLAVARITATDSEENPTASDLWIFGVNASRCQLTDTPAILESRPRWIDSTNILYDSVNLAYASGTAQSHVLTIER
jgi:hypothetical protein